MNKPTDDGLLTVDPTNPNTEVDGRDFLIWQRGYGTPGPDDNIVGVPAVQTDDGLLLPAVQDDSRSSHSGGVNVLLGDGSVRSTDTSAVATLMGFDFPSSDASGDYAGSHLLYQDVFIPALDTRPTLAIEDYWL